MSAESKWAYFYATVSLVLIVTVASLGNDLSKQDKSYQQAMIEAYNAYSAAIESRPEITKPGCKEVLAACEFERPASYLRTGR